MVEKIKVTFIETNCKKTGPIQQTLNIIRNMDRTKFEPSLITIWEEDENSIIDEYRSEKIDMYCCHLNKKESIWRGKREVTKILHKINPHIVQGVGMPLYRMALGYKKAVHFTTIRNYCYEDYPDRYGKIIGLIMAYMDIRLIRKQIKKKAPFVTCSKSLAKIYRERENIDLSYIRNGVDTNKFSKKDIKQKEEIRRRCKLPIEKKIFIYSGGIIDLKNQEEAIKAFIKMQKRNEAILLFLGDGKNREQLESMYGINDDIIFRGKVFNVEEYLHASDVYISTSKSEGLPNGVLEAMACGLPVILSDIPQHLEVIEAEANCGYSYKLGDIEQLAVIMDKILVEDFQIMGNNCYRSIINNFTSEGMSNRYQRMYECIAKCKR